MRALLLSLLSPFHSLNRGFLRLCGNEQEKGEGRERTKVCGCFSTYECADLICKKINSLMRAGLWVDMYLFEYMQVCVSPFSFHLFVFRIHQKMFLPLMLPDAARFFFFSFTMACMRACGPREEKEEKKKARFAPRYAASLSLSPACFVQMCVLSLFVCLF